MQAPASEVALVHSFHDVFNPGDIWIRADVTIFLGNQAEGRKMFNMIVEKIMSI